MGSLQRASPEQGCHTDTQAAEAETDAIQADSETCRTEGNLVGPR